MNLTAEYEKTIIKLGNFLCVSWIKSTEERSEDILVVSPYVTSSEIKVYHHLMYLWAENNTWLVEEPVGNRKVKNSFNSKLEAEDHIISVIINYWSEREAEL